MGAERAEALEVLRDVWRGQAQTVADLDDSCESHCKKMTDAGVGFDDYAAGDETDRIAAWRARLEREGKLSPAGSLRDLVLRPAGTAADAAADRDRPVEYPGTVAELTQRLRDGGYLADRGLATTLLVSLSLRRPVLLEGEVGVGKTEVAKTLAAVFGRKLIRLQCYEGISTSQALYEWDYARQMLQIRALSQAEATDERSVDQLFGPKFLLERPLLEAVRQGDRAVLLIDEIDRADDEFEAFLLEILSDFQISIPELGTIKADSQPGRHPDLQPDQGTARRAAAALPLPLDRLPDGGARGRDRRDPRARRGRAAHREGGRRPSSGCGNWTWPSRPGSRRRSTGSARSACSARPS